MLLSAHAQVAVPQDQTTILSAFETGSGSAEETDAFKIQLGGFLLSSIKTTFSLTDADGNGGQEVDFKKDLGGNSSLNVFRLDGEWRFADRHKILFTYYDLNQTASRVIDKEIEWGGEIYPINTTINTQFKTTIYKLDYGYNFFKSENRNHELNGLIGFHITSFKTAISEAARGSSEGVSVTAPLPVVGLEWKAKLTEKLTSKVSFEYFGVSLDNKYTGNLSDFQALLEYRLNGNWSLGGGYNRYTMRATVKGDGGRLKLSTRHSYNGLMLFASTHF